MQAILTLGKNTRLHAVVAAYNSRVRLMMHAVDANSGHS
jgi:hypothetical protein